MISALLPTKKQTLDRFAREACFVFCEYGPHYLQGSSVVRAIGGALALGRDYSSRRPCLQR
jgi:hypothetical protein